jgi:hypothetical protein
MIYLLDLNYTLVANSEDKRSPFAAQIVNEQYREELIAALQGSPVYLLTARPYRYESMTLKSIRDKTGWAPDRAYFNCYNLPPPAAKQAMLKEILQEHQPAELLAIESNPKTREMYARHGIKSQTWSQFLCR